MTFPDTPPNMNVWIGTNSISLVTFSYSTNLHFKIILIKNRSSVSKQHFYLLFNDINWIYWISTITHLRCWFEINAYKSLKTAEVTTFPDTPPNMKDWVGMNSTSSNFLLKCLVSSCSVKLQEVMTSLPLPGWYKVCSQIENSSDYFLEISKKNSSKIFN